MIGLTIAQPGRALRHAGFGARLVGSGSSRTPGTVAVWGPAAGAEAQPSLEVFRAECSETADFAALAMTHYSFFDGSPRAGGNLPLVHRLQPGGVRATELAERALGEFFRQPIELQPTKACRGPLEWDPGRLDRLRRGPGGG